MNIETEFFYLGFTFKPVRFLTPEEEKLGLKLPFCSIGISNYDDIHNYRSKEWNYEEFFQVAKNNDAEADLYLMNGKALVIPATNELFAFGKEEAQKLDVKKTLYKTVISVEILSEEPFEGDDLEVINEAITDGHCSGLLSDITRNKKLVGLAAADRVKLHGTDHDFFQMDANGFVVEED